MKKNNFTFADFLIANQNKKLGQFDYLHAIFTLSELPADLIKSFSQLFWPNYKLVDGFIFLEETFDQVHYEKYFAEKKNMKEIQFWINLIEITGIFPNLIESQAQEIAKTIELMWNTKIQIEFNHSTSKARWLHDPDTNEVFLTID
ncbi:MULTISPECIES: hypothetical protein [Leptospira]|uniref:Uncharacterized protein n=4 Tax=Leptospira TaxID=171 RepID=A0A0E2AYF7_9LEPT|nr:MULTISPECIES: hypothetical protein [Leptospira]EKO13994.1 hypothetical protein LEP1GSC081_1307 [Leptospira kirschneri str. H1]EKO85984.1 hypothetical protein LEP1GSC009_0606 [Leptospira interrogans serovar Grippotyphosa str. Andaman]EKP85287.1 hypothetical protein LEP1GSC020_0008 [Leptospira interrogans serovar Grippotyphosa str. 2006006986]MBE0302025.1 hypothetical protein [Leptospira interrogans serovar Yeoncheon]MBM2890578.1 hypothetical protein [Leptospira interrogans]